MSRPENEQTDDTYFFDHEGFLCMMKQSGKFLIPVRLANFDARIVRELIEDNGVDVTRLYTIEVVIRGMEPVRLDVPATSFPSMNWLHQLGYSAIIEPGFTIKDHVRHAIQTHSRDVEMTTCYTHTGWRKIKSRWAYLMTGGALGAEDVSVKMSRELQKYKLPLNPENKSEAMKISLSFLKIGEEDVTFPLFCLPYLSVLTTIINPQPNFSIFLYGETGLFKSTMAVILLSHFGTFDSISNLSNFEDTPNSVEKRAFTLKDTLMVLDDYCPSANRGESERKESMAQRIIRSYSNRTGRGRLNADTSDKGRYEPRGMLLITGEEIVSLMSTLARIFLVEIAKDDIDTEKLTEIQRKAHLLPHAMSFFILWVKDHLNNIKKTFNEEFPEKRRQASKGNMHGKLAEQIAYLHFTFDLVLQWMVKEGIMNNTKKTVLSSRSWEIFMKLAEKHNERLKSEDPVRRFVEILQTLIMQGKVNLLIRDSKGKAGYESDNLGGYNAEQIGWFDDEYLYLVPAATWNVIQKYCRAEGSHFPFKKNTLYKMLRSRGIIEASGQKNTVPVRINEKVIKVLKICRRGIA